MRVCARVLLPVLLIIATVFGAPAKDSRPDVVKRIDRATEVFNEIMAISDKGIPEDLLAKAECIAVVPGLKKGGLGIGGRYGKGVLMCRGHERSWSAPVFITVEGGSFGLQIGFEQIDLVMLVMNRSGVDKLIGDKFTLGGDVSVAAGPVGRNASAETDAKLTAEILTYSRAKGAFAGLTLNGAVVKPDKEDIRVFYGKELDPPDILNRRIPMPAEARALAAALSRQSPSAAK